MAEGFDRELSDLPPALRWREWMARVEAALFSSAEALDRAALAPLVGADCVLDLLIEDIAAALSDRPYEVVRSAGGWHLRTRARYAAAIRLSRGADAEAQRALTRQEALVLTIVAYSQPVTRAEITRITGREISRDVMARLHRQQLIAHGPRSPAPGAPYSYVTTPQFLLQFGLETLRDLPDLEALNDAGLLEAGPGAATILPHMGEGLG